MSSGRRSIEKIIEEQVRRWEILRSEKRPAPPRISVITVSREPGSGGEIVAREVAGRLGFDCFDHALIVGMAERAKVDNRILESLDEKGLNVLEHWIASLTDRRHLWPDQHLQHLMRIVGTIGKHGRAVVVGRGGNFILPPEGRFRVRVVAPLKVRAANVAKEFGVSAEEARRRIMRTESERRAFVRKYFYADIADPVNYDLVINIQNVGVETAVDMICRLAG